MPRKPTAVKELTGAAAKNPQRINKAEPKLELATLAPPAGLTPEARREWKRIAVILADRMKVLTEADRGALLGYCVAFGALVRAERTIAKEGDLLPVYAMDASRKLVLVDGKPITLEYKRHPAVLNLKDALTSMRGYAAIFGLSPADRSRVAATDAGKAIDPMANLIMFPGADQA
jgi:P27 family predicted phage terminase small subunit